MSNGAWFARRSERLRVTLHARLSTTTDGEGPETGVTLVNVTPEGCCMTTGGATLATGMAVLVRLESGEALTGWVRWCDGEKAGMEFDHLLAPSRVNYLRREHSTFMSEADHSQFTAQRSVC